MAAVKGDPAGRPDAALAARGPPGRKRRRLVKTQPDHPAVKVATLAIVAAIGHVEFVAGQGERATLALRGGFEGHAERAQRVGHIHRPARQHRAVGERQAEYQVPWPVTAVHHSIEIERTGALLDDRSAGNAEWVDVATVKLHDRGCRTKAALPDRLSGDSVERDHRVFFRRHDHQTARRARWMPVERLRIDVARHMTVERRIPPHVCCARPGQAGHYIVPAAGRVGVVGRHGRVDIRRARRRRKQQDCGSERGED